MTNITASVQPAEEVAFSLITKQWGEYSEAKIEQLIDKRFIPLMKRINADPDMATMYCCSGHIKKEKSYDPTGMLTVQKWDDLFNKFIFGQPT